MVPELLALCSWRCHQLDFNPSDIDYVNAHGTATENNDLSEGLGMKRLFGPDIPYFSSTKPYTGHTLAAAGSIEAVYCLMAITARNNLA